jgi:hypothetical protein
MKLKLIIIISHLNNWNYKPHLLLQFMTYCLVQSPFSFFLIRNNSFFNHVRDFHSKPRSKLKNKFLCYYNHISCNGINLQHWKQLLMSLSQNVLMI